LSLGSSILPSIPLTVSGWLTCHRCNESSQEARGGTLDVTLVALSIGYPLLGLLVSDQGNMSRALTCVLSLVSNRPRFSSAVNSPVERGSSTYRSSESACACRISAS